MAQLAPIVAFDRRALFTRLYGAHRTLTWAVDTLPECWHHRAPGGIVTGCEDGAWSVAQNLSHLVIYEEEVTLIALESLLNDGPGTGRSAPHDARFLHRWEALSTEPAAALLARLDATQQRLALLALAFDSAAFDKPAEPDCTTTFILDRHTPGWVVTRSVQHTWEHTVSVMGIALYAPCLP